MKTFFVLCLCAVAVSANILLNVANSSDEVKKITKKCLEDYKINPGVLSLNDDDSTSVEKLYDQLNEYQQSCITACVYKGWGALRADGTYDMEFMTEDKKGPGEKEKFLKIFNDCKSKAGSDHCKLFQCIDKAYPDN